MLDMREVRIKREWAEEALAGYARVLRDWNAPDDEHTRLTLRAMVEDTIKEVVPE